jgi:1-acyl-sn-glycerol-3-phosphate acyltransferase
VSRSIEQAQPPLTFIPPNYKPWVVRWVYRLLPFWMKTRTPIAQVETHNLEQLAQAYSDFESGKIRLLLAFRHPSVSDPIALGHMLSRQLPQIAKAQGINLKRPIHAHFMYDRGIPIWAGQFMQWLYARMGGTSILRGKLDRPGLRSARDLTLNGIFPLIAAPEGGTNGHNEIISPLEPGMAQLGFWCAEDLDKADRQEQVIILPIGLQYNYLSAPWEVMAQHLAALEAECGVQPPTTISLNPEALYDRLYKLSLHLMDQMEIHYRGVYHLKMDPVEDCLDPNEYLYRRLANLLETALTVAETYFQVKPQGSLVDRCRRLEQASWDRIYPDNIDLEKLSLIERRLADRAAQEAAMRLWNVRLVESFISVTGSYVRDHLSADRFSEILLILWDTLSRIQGNRNPFDRPKFGDQRARITIGAPINISDRYAQYRENRRGAKGAIARLTEDLQTALESMIEKGQ